MNIPFSNLQLSTNNRVIPCQLNDDITIGVRAYLPIEDKYDLIMMVLQNSFEDGHYNELKLDMYFHLYVVYMYTDIEFTAAQKEEPAKLFDLLMGNGIMDKIIYAMDGKEYDYLCETLNKEVEATLKYKNTIASVINNFIDNLPVNAEKAKDIIEQFNPEDFQNVLMMARAANGNRPID